MAVYVRPTLALMIRVLYLKYYLRPAELTIIILL